MSRAQSHKRTKLIAQTLIYAAITAVLYAAAFYKPDAVAEYFARGGYYAVFPIATVFVFSFAHGAFASNLWSVLGVHAEIKQAAERPEVTAPRPAQRPRPRLRMSL
ncbi:MAG: hypothetical protein HY913_12245 [Desulfomonile tiedjei]|nr:hypothetical protein [Desulfomonile tiedjei]